jgi:uncharacterized protein YcbK (DUF882 family)
VTVKVAHRNLLPLRWAQASYCCSIAALLVFFGCEGLQNATAEGETRTISFHHIHTNEDLTITYKVRGQYDDDALAKINNVLRDWRESEPIKMDPHLIDLLWEVHRETGSKEPIWVVCGYRSPATNSALRRHSSGVAKFSQHMLGKAVDFYIPGVPLDQLRAAGLRAQRGGVGFYPTSGSPFVHMDTGSVRHWPRMPETQLASVLSQGPLNSRSASDARGTAVAQAGVQPSSRKSIGLLARLFGGGKDEEEDAETAAQPAPAPVAAAAKAKAPAPRTAAVVISPEPRSDKDATSALPAPKSVKPAVYQVASAGSKPVVKPAETKPADIFELASTTSRPVILASDQVPSKPMARPAQAASLVARADMTANDIINERGYWQGLPSIDPADAPQVGAAKAGPAPRRPVTTASADPATTASVTPWPLVDRTDNEPLPSALAYAAQPTPIAAARALPMGTGRVAPTADTTVAVKQSDDRISVTPPKPKAPSVVRVGDRFNDPWLRAMIVSPSAQSFMKTSMYGIPDFRSLLPQMQKPASAVMMTFGDDPYLGMSSERFAGGAVVFTPTVTFNSPRTASLR